MPDIKWKRGDVAWWDDPDGGKCSGIRIVSSGDASPDEVVLDEGNLVVPVYELRRPTADEAKRYEGERKKYGL